MKKFILGVLLTISMLTFGGIFSKKESAQVTYLLEAKDAKNWEETIDRIIKEEAYIPDWYGGENGNVVYYLRMNNIMKAKDYEFLQTLSNKEEYEIIGEDYDNFIKLLDKYRNRIERNFHLKNENIKNAKALVRKIVLEGEASKLKNASTQIKSIIKPEEWSKLVAFSKQNDLTAKDVKVLRKILNEALNSELFYDANIWYGIEASSRTALLDKLNKGFVEKRERNNINAKAMYIAYSEYLSELYKWGK